MRVTVSSYSGGRGCGFLFGLLFAGFGLAFTFMIARTLPRLYAPWFWPATDCTILESRFVDGTANGAGSSDEPFRFEARYRYGWQGQDHESTVVRRGYHGGQDAAAAQRLAARYPAGTSQRCFVDPKAPQEAVLERPRLLPLAVLLFPLLFVGVGVVVAVVAVRGSRAAAAGAPGAPASAVQPLARPDNQGLGCASAFFGIFAVFGAGFLVPFFGLPVWHISQARSWNAVPCTIVASGVESHSSSDGGPTYSVEINYRYTVAGHPYVGTRYGFMGGSSSGRSGKEAVIARLPPGTETTCYVNPADPTDAVLERGFTPELWFGLIPLVFVIVGLGGIVGVNYGARRNASARGVARWVPGVRSAKPALALGVEGARELADDPSAPRVLQPAHSPLGKVGCAFALAVFLSGFVGIFLWKAVFEPLHQGGSPEGCVVLFLIPFTLLALGSILNVPYQILALFNPRSRLELAPGVLRPGEPARLRWQFTGLASRLARVVITLEGSEEATHRVGTTTRTDRSTFLKLTLLECEQAEQIRSGGEVAVDLPASVVHSFAGSHNKIVYKMTLRGTIARWPDVQDDYTIEVGPEKGGA